MNLFAAAFIAMQPIVILTGNAYYADGSTPIQGKGGVDWKVEPRDSCGNPGAFTVKYDGNRFSVSVDLTKLPEAKDFQMSLWHGEACDRVIEGLSTVGRTQIIDVVFSAKGP